MPNIILKLKKQKPEIFESENFKNEEISWKGFSSLNPCSS